MSHQVALSVTDFTLGGCGQTIEIHVDHFCVPNLRAILLRSASQRLRVTIPLNAVSRLAKSCENDAVNGCVVAFCRTEWNTDVLSCIRLLPTIWRVAHRLQRPVANSQRSEAERKLATLKRRLHPIKARYGNVDRIWGFCKR